MTMAKNPIKLEADVVLAGGGPAGCTIARELSKKGKKVILLEKGGDDISHIGSGFYNLMCLEKEFHFPLPLKKTMEGDTLILANCLGGGTLLYAGSAFEPDIGFWKKYGIEFDQELIDEAIKECWVNLPPEEFIGRGVRRIWEAADALNLPFEKLYRHVDFDKCKPGCAGCSNGCRVNAKWTAREYALEAIENGAKVLTHTEVKDVIIENGSAGGLRAVGKKGRTYEINAKVVVCTAGGTHTAGILQRSGFFDAGRWYAGDPTFFTFGFVKDGPVNGSDHMMTIGWNDEEHHVVFCTTISPAQAWKLMFLQDEFFKSLTRLHRFSRTLGVFAKIADDGEGQVRPDGKLSKTFTEQDMKRFEYASDINKKILIKAGCDPNDIHNSSFTLGHPSGTVRVGEMLDTNLETSVRNLYCCDTSVVPGAPGRPPALTIVCLAKRLSKRLEAMV